jgi:hypothetical protein
LQSLNPKPSLYNLLYCPVLHYGVVTQLFCVTSSAVSFSPLMSWKTTKSIVGILEETDLLD